MAFAAGTRLGSYEIESLLGAGGMGEVYRARDVRLNRTVAIKVLGHQLTDPDRERRFLQEARAASALNHPHIVTLHDIVRDAGVEFLVMEYVPGKPLDRLISGNRLSLTEAVAYGQQIAGALAAAHAAGIVHRDIKPGNIIIAPDGHVKVLDFGLAKLAEREPRGPQDQTRTQAAALTEAGTVLGTTAYMSPEQASGRELDHRTDIFSLGVVLYEMLNGQRPFRGKSQIETLHAIINDPPPSLAQPPELQDILDKALAKDPRQRYQHAGDLALDLARFPRWPTASPGTDSARRRRHALLWIAARVWLLTLPVAWWTGRRSAPALDQSAAAVAVASITPFTTNPGYNGEATIAPDNQTIAYVSNRSGRFDIYLRQIGASTDIALTRDQGDNIQPSFSPDGRQMAFVSSRGGAEIFYPGFDYPMVGGDIWVMPALGGIPRRIARDGNFPSWSPDGSKIVFARHRIGLFEVAASGGEPRPIPLPTNARTVYYPSYSSDATWVFFEANSFVNAAPVSGGDVQPIGTGRNPVWDQASQAVIYSDSREGNNHSLWAVPFSVKDGKPSGSARPITIGRGRDWQPAVSRDGTLVAFTAFAVTFNLESVPFDAEAGRVLGAPRVLTTGNQVSYFMRFSPDGRSVAFESSRGAGRHIWRVDTDAQPVQLTADPRFEETFPHWSPDGKTIAFTRHPAQTPNQKTLWLMDADGANPRQILEGNNLTRWLPDGSGIVYQSLRDQSLVLYDLVTGRSRPISTTSDVATMPMVSPNGQWLAYQATTKDVGNIDVHAVGLNGGEPRVVAATPRQDYHPFFSPSGHWVYFQQDHKNLYRVPGPGQEWQRADPIRMTDFPESGLYLEDPQISQDGKQLLYARGTITGDIWILRRAKQATPAP